MKHYVALIILTAFGSPASAEVNNALGNNAISDFKYTSCNRSECVVVSAPKAWMSVLRGGFSTDGATQLQVYDTTGGLKSTASGLNATYNPDLDLIMLEQASGEVLMQKLEQSASTRPSEAKRKGAP